MTLKFFQSFVIALGITGLTTLLKLIVSTSPILSQASSSANPDKVTFSCMETFDEASGENIPATVAWIPERQGNILFVAWKSEFFTESGWAPQNRCQIVTEKSQKYYTQGSLAYLSHGMHNGLPIICALTEQGKTCNGNNQLFTIKPSADSGLVLQRLMEILEAKSGDFIIQTSAQTYVPVEKFLKEAPLMKQGN